MEINSGTVLEKRRQQIDYRDSRDPDTRVDDSCLKSQRQKDYILVHSFLQLLLLKQQDSWGGKIAVGDGQ